MPLPEHPSSPLVLSCPRQTNQTKFMKRRSPRGHAPLPTPPRIPPTHPRKQALNPPGNRPSFPINMRRPAHREPAHANKLPARPRPNLPAEIELNRPPASRSRGPASSLLKELNSGGHPSAADRPTNDASRTRSTPRTADGSLSEWRKGARRRGCGGR